MRGNAEEGECNGGIKCKREKSPFPHLAFSGSQISRAVASPFVHPSHVPSYFPHQSGRRILNLGAFCSSFEKYPSFLQRLLPIVVLLVASSRAERFDNNNNKIDSNSQSLATSSQPLPLSVCECCRWTMTENARRQFQQQHARNSGGVGGWKWESSSSIREDGRERVVGVVLIGNERPKSE